MGRKQWLSVHFKEDYRVCTMLRGYNLAHTGMKGNLIIGTWCLCFTYISVWAIAGL